MYVQIRRDRADLTVGGRLGPSMYVDVAYLYYVNLFTNIRARIR